jgi:hypothetical protein
MVFIQLTTNQKQHLEKETDQNKQRFEIQLILKHKLQHPTKILARKSSLTRGSLQITQLETTSRRKSRSTIEGLTLSSVSTKLIYAQKKLHNKK